MDKRAAVDKATTEGEAKGESKGESKAILSMAQKMKAMGKSIDEICQLTGLSPEEAESL